MTKILSLLAAASILSVAGMAYAEDKPMNASAMDAPQPVSAATPVTSTVTAPQNTTAATAATPATPVTAATASIPPGTAAMEAPATVDTLLKDGTPIEIGADNTVQIINTDGSKVSAPDGMLTLRNGAEIIVKNGVKVEG